MVSIAMGMGVLVIIVVVVGDEKNVVGDREFWPESRKSTFWTSGGPETFSARLFWIRMKRV